VVPCASTENNTHEYLVSAEDHPKCRKPAGSDHNLDDTADDSWASNDAYNSALRLVKHLFKAAARSWQFGGVRSLSASDPISPGDWCTYSVVSRNRLMESGETGR
jgi:hypothetical protein